MNSLVPIFIVVLKTIYTIHAKISRLCYGKLVGIPITQRILHSFMYFKCMMCLIAPLYICIVIWATFLQNNNESGQQSPVYRRINWSKPPSPASNTTRNVAKLRLFFRTLPFMNVHIIDFFKNFLLTTGLDNIPQSTAGFNRPSLLSPSANATKKIEEVV